MPEKYFVAGLDTTTNSVIVARGASNPALFARGLSSLASEFHWVAGSPPAGLVPLLFGRHNPAEAAIEASAGGEDKTGAETSGRLRCTYRCRHRQELLPCTVELGLSSTSPLELTDVRALGGEGRGAARIGGREDGGRLKEMREPPCSNSVLPSAAATIAQQVSEHAAAANGRTARQTLQIIVRFDEPAKAIAPGQVVALYKDGVCLGGGPILKADWQCSPVLVRPHPLPLPSNNEK